MVESFEEERKQSAQLLGASAALRNLSVEWMRRVSEHKYSYNFDWLGRPIIQFPQDIVALQELIWKVRPDLVVETGVAHGGSLILHASILELLGEGEVVGIDIDIREHNRNAIMAHSLSRRITLLEGSSVEAMTVERVRAIARNHRRVLVVLDSDHTHAHVLRELELYSPLVQPGSYLIVFDTIIEELPAGFFADRPWDKGNNPSTAVREFLRHNRRFVVDADFEAKLLITTARGGYLRCVA